MKNFKISIAWLAVFALFFTSCSKEESGVGTDDPEIVQLTFGALLNAFEQQNRQAEIECRDDVAPAYVMVGISSDADDIPQPDELIKVWLKNNNGSWETEYSEKLAFPADTYYLQHFVVYDAGGHVLWIAPREGGAFADEVSDALPLQINLTAGTKPYINVDVLCYEAREEVAYGYPFFDFDVIPVENSYCVFINYCDEETGREYPSNFRLDIWTDGYGGNNLLTTGMNTVDIPEEGWPAASVLCVALPEIVGEPLYARVTVLNDGQAYTPGAGDVHDFRISQAHLNSIETSATGYEHFRIGCDDDGGNGGTPPADIDGDGTPDANDDCPTVSGPASNKGCPVETCDISNPEGDCDGDYILNKCDEDNANYTSFDCDNDQIANSNDDCPSVVGVSGPEGKNGCPIEGSCVNETPCNIGEVDPACLVASTVYSDPEEDFIYFQGGGYNYGFGIYNMNYPNTILGNIWTEAVDGNLVVRIDMVDGYTLDGYVIEVRRGESYIEQPDDNCVEFACDSNPSNSDEITEIFNPLAFTNGSYEGVHIRFKAYVCPVGQN